MFKDFFSRFFRKKKKSTTKTGGGRPQASLRQEPSGDPKLELDREQDSDLLAQSKVQGEVEEMGLDDKPPSGLINMKAGIKKKDEPPSSVNGGGKPRVDVIDAMGNSVSEMVSNIAKQLEASTDQLSRSRKYTNFAMILLGVTLLGTIIAMGSVAWTLSSQMGNVDEAISSLRSQAGVQDKSAEMVSEIKNELQQLLERQSAEPREGELESILANQVQPQMEELAALIDKIAVNQSKIEVELSSVSQKLSKGVQIAELGNSKAMEKALAKVEERVGDLYTIEKARIAREIADLRSRRSSQ